MTTILAFLLVIFVLVIVHEYGHYLAARLAGVKVLRFSVGFGKPLLVKRLGRDNTEWTLCALPLGGYVKMLDEREGDVDGSELHRAFNRASVWRRIAIVAAGPLANFVLAVVVFWALLIHGIPAIKPIIGAPAEGTPAAMAGLRNGDEVVRMDGSRVRTFAELRMRLMEAAAGKAQPVLELANGERRQIDFSGLSQDYLDENGRSLGIEPYMPPLAPVIGSLIPGSVAEQAGLKPGDRILAVDGQDVADWETFAQYVRGRAGVRIDLLIETGGQRRTLSLTPASVSENGGQIGRVGVSPQVAPSLFAGLRTEERYAPPEALWQAAVKTWDTAAFSLKMLGRMVLGEVSWRNLSGPVSIADYAGQSAGQGWLSFAGFLAIISIGLGVINLLPIPLLDGGHLMYYFVEIFQGRPVSERIMELGARIGMAVIGALMFLALYNDVLRLLNG
ncbi:MAG: RIP metalloprotease RseP [Pseudomonadota bacterium]